jgi:hypothetical protein
MGSTVLARHGVFPGNHQHFRRTRHIGPTLCRHNTYATTNAAEKQKRPCAQPSYLFHVVQAPLAF